MEGSRSLPIMTDPNESRGPKTYGPNTGPQCKGNNAMAVDAAREEKTRRRIKRP
jgi:hypothetical protein